MNQETQRIFDWLFEANKQIGNASYNVWISKFEGDWTDSQKETLVTVGNKLQELSDILNGVLETL